MKSDSKPRTKLMSGVVMIRDTVEPLIDVVDIINRRSVPIFILARVQGFGSLQGYRAHPREQTVRIERTGAG